MQHLLHHRSEAIRPAHLENSNEHLILSWRSASPGTRLDAGAPADYQHETLLMTARRISFRQRRLARTLIAVSILLGAGAAVVWGFIEGRSEVEREAERERPVKEPLRVAMMNGVPVIAVDEPTQQSSGIETSVLTSAPFQEQVRAYAMVIDPARLTDLSNNYANAKSQLQTSQAKLVASKAAFERAQSLLKFQAASVAQLQVAESTFMVDQAALAGTESQVRTLSATAHQEWGPILGKSLVESSTTVTRLIERQDFLLQVTLPPGVSVLKPPPTAAVQIGQGTRSKITFISQATRTDPRIQGASFFYSAQAENDLLPGMNVLAFLPSGKSVDGVTIPASATVWWQDKAWVYRRIEASSFTRVEIATDLPVPGGGYVVGGFSHSIEIVTRGAQLLLSEEFRAQIQVGEDKK